MIQPPLDFIQPAPARPAETLLWIPDEYNAPPTEIARLPYTATDDDLPAIFFHD